jgi:hypothetical protein
MTRGGANFLFSGVFSRFFAASLGPSKLEFVELRGVAQRSHFCTSPDPFVLQLNALVAD